MISLTNISIAKASILEKRGRCSINDELNNICTSDPIKSDVYFHMVKIIDENIFQWQVFEQKIKSMEKSIQVMYNKRRVYFTAGLNHFNIIKRREDLFVAYASIILNKTIFPPDWEHVECMVSIIAKEGIPYFTNMGIFTMMHTFPLESYNYQEDRSSRKLILLPEISGNDVDTELSNYFTTRGESYPAHKYISAHLFTFIGTHINNFYADEKTALFTSPTEGIASILSKVFNNYKIIYGIEEDKESRYLGLEKDNKPDDSFVRIVLYNGVKQTQTHLDLNKNELEKLCPWYCNIFIIDDGGNKPDDTPECYSSVIYSDPFVYVPVSSFIELSSKEEYAFISI